MVKHRVTDVEGSFVGEDSIEIREKAVEGIFACCRVATSFALAGIPDNKADFVAFRAPLWKARMQYYVVIELAKPPFISSAIKLWRLLSHSGHEMSMVNPFQVDDAHESAWSQNSATSLHLSRSSDQFFY